MKIKKDKRLSTILTQFKRNVNLTGIFLLILLSYATLYSGVINKTVARINDDVILLSEFDKVSEPFIEQMKAVYSRNMSPDELNGKISELKKKLLDRMIDQKLLLQEAKKKKIKVSKKELANGMSTIKERFKTKDGKPVSEKEAETEFNAELKKQNLTLTKFNEQLKEEIMVNNLIDMDVVAKVAQPTEKDILKYYEDNKDKLVEPEKYLVSHILIRFDPNASIKEKSQAMKKIKDVESKLKNGEDFTKVAQQYSEDPGSARQGGDLGEVEKGMMVKKFEDVMIKTPVNKTSSIFETEFGYHILKVTSKKPKKERTFEEVKEYLTKYMMLEKQQEQYETYIKNLRANATISYTDDIK